MGAHSSRAATRAGRSGQAEEATQRGSAKANEAQALLAREQEVKQRAIAETEKRRAMESRNRALDALRVATGEDVEMLIGSKKVLGQNECVYGSDRQTLSSFCN